MKLQVTTRDGIDHRIDAVAGESVMEAIRKSLDEEPFGVCSGMCSCASCHVYIADEFLAALPAISEDEDDMLDGVGDRRANSRLSCQIELAEMLDGLRLTVAPE